MNPAGEAGFIGFPRWAGVSLTNHMDTLELAPVCPAMSSIVVLKVAIVEDQPRIRESLRILIGGTEGFRCTADFECMEDALAKIGGDLPDVALVDIGLPGMNGVDGIRALRKSYPGLTVLMLTVYDDDKRIFDALCAGACGYLLKKTPRRAYWSACRKPPAAGRRCRPKCRAAWCPCSARSVRRRKPATS